MQNRLFVLIVGVTAALLIWGCGGSSSNDDEFESAIDTTAPTLAEVTAVTTPTSDTTPNYTFSSSEAGTITYGGSCSRGTTSASSGNNTVTFNTLSDGTYSDCTITVTDSAGNSSTLSVRQPLKNSLPHLN